MGGLIPRRLSRARSTNVITNDANLMIGVSIEAKTVEAEHAHPEGQVVVHAAGALRNRASRNTIAGTESVTEPNWLSKVTQKLHRKSKRVLGSSRS